MNPTEISLRSESVKEILSKPPNWLIRWGITVIFGVVILMVLLSIYVKYPDVVVASATITTTQPPSSVKALSSGKISHLFVSENETVEASQTLAVIDNPADYEDWKSLKADFLPFYQNLLQSDSIGKLVFGAISQKSGKSNQANSINHGLSLGEMQSSYTQFFRAYQDYWIFERANFYDEKIAQTRQKIISQRQLSQGLSRQKAIMQTDFSLTEKQFGVDKILFGKQVITERELANAEKAFLAEKLTIERSDLDRINSNIRIQELEAQILELRQNYREERTKFLESLKQASLNLEASMTTWEKRYLLQAPIAGKVSFFKFWSNNQFVNANDEVMVILPNSKNLFGIASVPQAGFGKVKEGQKVLIRFNGFPFEEFGSVTGIVESISAISREEKHIVRISLPNGLKTNYQKELSFSQEMQGEAQIITEDLRLIERFFYQIRKYISQ
ncbi:MAG: HlyD family secretion protein [Flammeovirgaceae bacterium]|jgi:HlyD family secretion protein